MNAPTASPWTQRPQKYYDEDNGLDSQAPPSFEDHLDADDNAFNTSAIHGVNDPYGAMRVTWWRRRSALYAAAAVALVVLIIGVSVGAAGGGGKSRSNNDAALSQNAGSDSYIPNAPPGSSYSRGSNGGQPNADNSGYDAPVVGDTKDGPKEPVMEIPQEKAQTNRDEFGTTLVGLYDRHNMEWASLSKADTPQSKALLFVTASQNYDSMPQSKRIQRYALGVFYYSTFMQAHAFWTDPTDWTSAYRWMTAEDECLWEGIVCHETSKKVTAIILPTHALSGYLPTELALLDELQEVDLSQNYLHMTPSKNDDLRVFGMLKQLKKLELGDNYILTEQHGLPTSIGKLLHLQRLSMSYNLLQGPLDGAVVRNLQQLTHLEIESNYLSGALPEELGQLPRLYYLYLRRNLLEINLSDLLAPAGAYNNIFSFWLDDNSVTGSLPTAIGRLTGLASFSITNTTLSGSIPTEIGNCRELQRLWLYSNKLRGKVPTELSQLEHLQVLEVHDNQVTGKMPQEVCTAVNQADYEFKTLTADCSLVECDDCCTECY